MSDSPARIDWLHPLALFAPSDDNILAPIPLPAWILREFGSRLEARRTYDGPSTGLVLAPDRTGRIRGVRWAADQKWGPPSLGALETLLWIRHATVIRRLPDGVVQDPSIRLLASWREGMSVSGAGARDIRAHLLMLSAVRAWYVTAARPGDDLTWEELEAWDRRMGRTGDTPQVRSGGILEVGFDPTVEGPHGLKVHITKIAIHADVLCPEANEPLVWIDPHWHAGLPALGVRFLHRLLDPLLPGGWDEGGVAQTYPEMIAALGITTDVAWRVGRVHAAITEAGEALVRAGWIEQWHAKRMPRGDARVAVYHWAPNDRLIAHRSLAGLSLEGIEYRDRVIPAVMVTMGVPPVVVAEWVRKHSAGRLRELLQYLMFRNNATSKEIRHPYAYMKHALEKGEALDDLPAFKVFVREQTRAFLPAITEPIALTAAPRALGSAARALALPPAPQAPPGGQPNAVQGEPVPLVDREDLTRRVMAFIATHASLEVSAPFTEEPIRWHARKQPGGGLRIEVPSGLLARIRETPTLDALLRKAAMAFTEGASYMLTPLSTAGDGTGDEMTEPDFSTDTAVGS